MRPKRVIDLGSGTGKYGFLLREQCDLAMGRTIRDGWKLHIEGVEGFAPNVTEISNFTYNNVWITNCLDFAREYRGAPFDVALAIEVLEHFTPSDGIEFVKDVLRFSSVLLIATPKSYFPQDTAVNSLEWHRSWWPPKALRQLARLCNAELSLVKLPLSSLAALSTSQRPPVFKLDVLKRLGVVLKDTLLPERTYYRLIGGTGPSIFDQQESHLA
jgi:hypothetical protein